MQRKNLKYFLPIIGAGLLTFGFVYQEYNKDKENLVFQLVGSALDNYHYQPRKMDDTYSKDVFNAYLERIDYNKLYFTQSEVNNLRMFELHLDDAMISGDNTFFNLSYSLLDQGIDRSEAFFEDILSAPLQFTPGEKLASNPEEVKHASSESALKDYWERHLKWRVLNRIYEKDKAQKEDAETDETVVLKSFEELESIAREKELELQQEWLDDLQDITRLEWLGMLLTSYSEAHDPHTNYMAPEQNEDFELSMTGQFYGIGAQLKKVGDYITIERIITGSACWKQGDLEAGDKIIAVAQGDGEPLDIVGWKTREAIKHIRGEKGKEVRLTVKKKDGSRMVIPIVRDIVELEATYAKSAVLDGSLYQKTEDKTWGNGISAGPKTGIIRLPKFYVKFYSKDNRDAAEDIKKEIVKLKKEGVEALILDLRNNGGGSMQAAVDIAGLFTGKGPMVQVKSFQGQTVVKNSKDPKVYWDGPLIVLVNEYSASASEIVSAALQDRGRALIVGTGGSTFGKGTVQNMINFDNVIKKPFDQHKPLGALKVTTDKFYRISGNTTQLQGVIPDIRLASPYDLISIGEKEYDLALPVDKIAPAAYAVDTRWQKNFGLAEARSEQRVSTHPDFEKINSYAQWIAASDATHYIPLEPTAYFAYQDSISTVSEQYKGIGKSKDSVGVLFTVYDTTAAVDSATQTTIQRWHKALSKDIVIQESLRIANDLVN